MADEPKKDSSQHPAEPALYGPDNKLIPLSEKSEAQPIQPAPPEQSIRFHRLRGISLGLILRRIVQLLLTFATLLAPWQLLVLRPDIHPIDFGAKGPYPAMFAVHNPFLTGIYRAQVAVAFGGGMVTTGPGQPDLREPLKQFAGPTACEQLGKYRDLKAVAGRGTIVLDVAEYPMIGPGEDVPFVTGITIQGMRFTLAIGVRYRMTFFNFASSGEFVGDLTGLSETFG